MATSVAKRCFGTATSIAEGCSEKVFRDGHINCGVVFRKGISGRPHQLRRGVTGGSRGRSHAPFRRVAIEPAPPPLPLERLSEPAPYVRTTPLDLPAPACMASEQPPRDLPHALVRAGGFGARIVPGSGQAAHGPEGASDALCARGGGGAPDGPVHIRAADAPAARLCEPHRQVDGGGQERQAARAGHKTRLAVGRAAGGKSGARCTC
jgi:hypothetical protein